MDPLKQKVARLLLEECKAGNRRWYYISVATDVFQFGCVVEGFGPTDAWLYIHKLGWYEVGSTQTHGPITKDILDKIPVEMRWRKLTKEESLNLGK